MYPAVYVILTLPIAVGRMVTMAGVEMPDLFFCIAGSFLTSCGWIDALLYALTRRVLVGGDISGHHYNRTTASNVARPGDHYGLQSMDKEMGAARTVTIVGGSNRISRMVDHSRGRKSHRVKGHPETLAENSLSGSQDSIMKPGPNSIGIVTETNIQVESASGSPRHSESDTTPIKLTSRSNSEGGFSARSH